MTLQFDTINQIAQITMREGKIWQKDEDQTLKQLIEVYTQQKLQPKPKWSTISKQLKLKLQKSSKTAKQCRQRWYHKLCPGIKQEEDWSKQEEELLFNLHNELGNKWAQISHKIQGRTDNSIKNHFYSTIRRGLRRVNQYIVHQKRKSGSFKQFKPQLLNKVIAVVDRNCQNKLDIKDQGVAFNISCTIKNQLIQISKYDHNELYQQTQQLIQNLQQFSRICKKKKGTKNFQSSLSKSNDKKYSILPKLREENHHQMIKLPLPRTYKASNDQKNQKIPQYKLISQISSCQKSIQTITSSIPKQHQKPHNQYFTSSFLNNIENFTAEKKYFDRAQKHQEQFQIPFFQVPYQNILNSRIFDHLIQSGDLIKVPNESIKFGLLSQSLNFRCLQQSYPDISIQYQNLPKHN